jgi:hypothetical protein
MAVAEARYRGAAAGVEIAPAIRVDEENALPAGCDGRTRAH